MKFSEKYFSSKKPIFYKKEIKESFQEYSASILLSTKN
jgi:hypothetical protein